MGQILRTDGRARSSCIVDKFLAGHLLFLFGVVSIRRKHDDGISQWKQLISIVITVYVAFIKSQGKLPNDSLYLLRLSWQPKLAK